MFGHVTRQVRFLCVRLSADPTDERLQVFRFRVFRDVVTQALFVGEALVAGVAAVGPVGHVRTRV